jgi:two-component system chemotaxis response regulator CheB
MRSNRKVRVLVVDDSAMVRRAISEALQADPEIEVVGTAVDPYVARDKILELAPDVLTLDIEMPRMDGLTFLRILQQHRPMPVIVISSTTAAGSAAAIEALECGAVDVLCKPTSAYSIGALASELPARVRMAAGVRLFGRGPGRGVEPALGVAGSVAGDGGFSPRQVVLIGASTGGTEAVKKVLGGLPAAMPGICVVQHIPPVFSKAFAERLNQCCALEVREAEQGDQVREGLVLVAPGDQHMTLEWGCGGYRVRLNRGPMLNHVRPAVDVLFASAAGCSGARVVAALLTGMGRDGAMGMKRLRDKGATTIAQDEGTCMVYGMPKAAVAMGGVGRVLPLGMIAAALVKGVRDQAEVAEADRFGAGADMRQGRPGVQAQPFP